MSGRSWGPRVHSLRPGTRGAWLARCQTNARADPLPNLFNCVLALREDPAWAALAFDEMLQCAVLRGPDRQLRDVDVYRAHLWMQEAGIEKMPLEVVREAVEIVAHERPFHPLRDELNALVWDGTLRLADWLHKCLGAPDDEYHKQIGTKFLIGMVARVMQPGCKMDYMLVLEGVQGKMKSMAASILAGRYFSDHLPDLASDPVRLSMHMRGKWLIEVADLAAFASSHIKVEHLKAFITRPAEQFTPKYARREIVEPRQCALFGTTNEAHYLKDDTGNRRFWPARCGKMDLELLRQDRDQLFAEAVEEFRKGAPWWPDPAIEEQYFRPQQDERTWVDAWEEPVVGYLAGKISVHLHDVAWGALQLEKARLGAAEQRRIASLLRAAGWERRRTTGGVHVWSPRP